MPSGVEVVDRLLRLGSDLVLDGHDAGHGAIDDDVEDRPSLLVPVRRLRMRRQTQVLQQPRPADEDVVAVDLGPRAATGQRLEVGGWPGLDTALLGAVDDRARERVLRVGLDRGREPEDALDVHRVGRHVDEDRLALGQGPGLVEDHGVDGPGPLEREAVLDQEPVLGAERGGDGDDERDRQTEGMRAGDHQHRRRAHERALRVAEEPPADEGDGAGGEGDVEQDRRGAVGQRLRPRCRRLRLRDHAHDPGQGRLVAGRRDLDAQASRRRRPCRR